MIGNGIWHPSCGSCFLYTAAVDALSSFEMSVVASLTVLTDLDQDEATEVHTMLVSGEHFCNDGTLPHFVLVHCVSGPAKYYGNTQEEVFQVPHTCLKPVLLSLCILNM